jgi:tetratricopeptide (TPR) repeat protein
MQEDDLLHRLRDAPSDEERDWLILQFGLSALSPGLRDAVRVAAVPHWFDREFLAALLKKPGGGERQLWESLTALSFIESFPDRGYDVHQRTRALLLKRFWRDEPDRFRETSKRAASYCEAQGRDVPAWRIEWIYHLLVALPEEGQRHFEKVGVEWEQIYAYDRVEALVRASEEHAEAGRLSDLGTALTVLWQARVNRSYLRFGSARERYEEAARLFRQLGEEERQAWALLNAGEAGQGIDEYAIARKHYASALRLFEKVPERRGQVSGTIGLGNMSLAFGDFVTAGNYYREARRISNEIGDREKEATATFWLAEVHRALGEYKAALADGAQAVELAASTGSTWDEASALQGLGSVHCALHEFDAARDCFNRALEIGRQTRNRQVDAYSLEGLGRVCLGLGDPSAARGRCNEATAIFREIGDRRGLAGCLRWLGEACYRLTEAADAGSCYKEALKICRDIDDRIGEADCLMHLAELDLAAADLITAESACRIALDQYRSSAAKPRIAWALFVLGRIRARRGDREEAHRHLNEALAVYAALHSPRVAEVEAELISFRPQSKASGRRRPIKQPASPQ